MIRFQKFPRGLDGALLPKFEQISDQKAKNLHVITGLVAGGPKSIKELVEATHTHGSSMARFLRTLTSLGIFAADTTGRFRQTALSDTLRSDHPESIRPLAMMLGAHFVWEPSGVPGPVLIC